MEIIVYIYLSFVEKGQTFILKARFSNAVHAVGIGLEVPETINGFENFCHVVIILSIEWRSPSHLLPGYGTLFRKNYALKSMGREHLSFDKKD